MLVTAAGLGMLFMPLTLVALSKVGDRDAGVASSLVNTGQQVGGSIGLAILGTVAWTLVASTARHSVAVAKATAVRAAAAGHAIHPTTAQVASFKKAVTDHALAVGFSRGFEVSAGVAVLGLIITLIMIRVTKEDLQGIDPMMMG
jgi:ABC-type phosphate transport system permease subunit